MTSVGLHDVRNYASLEFVPSAGLNVLRGANAQGKTNLLEAIAMLGTGKSFRTPREREVVRSGAESATIRGEALRRAGIVRLSCGVVLGPHGARKRYAVNGAGVGYAAYLGRARVVTFVPQDLDLAGGPPARRRAMLNAALAQEQPAYYAALSDYTRNLAQKNALLRGAIVADAHLLATYDERLIVSGAQLMTARAAFVHDLDAAARAQYDRWADSTRTLRLAYVPNVAADSEDGEAFAAAFAAALERMRSVERARGAALVGPHRDDLAIALEGQPLATFGSQGERRSAVLALKLAEHAVLSARVGESPLLLLDDVLSELDGTRQRALLEAVAGLEQTFVTTTLADATPRAAATFQVADATVERFG
ncbi:MAG: DNA replication/repair protein RecF [Candidatus Baltobacteraceae bacterium]